jgi:hypothetical protein
MGTQRLARYAARRFHEHPEDIPVRRGGAPLPHGVAVVTNVEGVSVLWNIHPHDLQDWEWEEARRRVKADGVEELASAVYPEQGEGAGRTRVLVLRAGAAEHKRLWEVVVTVAQEAVHRLQNVRDMPPGGMG